MRVISGTAKGHRLVAPKSSRVRPALDQVKEAVFNILFNVTETRVLDLYAGSGSIGIEALSRGAVYAVFVDEWDKSVESIHKNLKHCKLEGPAKVILSKVFPAIKMLERKEAPFDLIFVDPPYEKNLVNPTLKMLSNSKLLSDNTLIIVEHHPKEPIDEDTGLILTDSRKYGQTCISFLKPSCVVPNA